VSRRVVEEVLGEADEEPSVTPPPATAAPWAGPDREELVERLTAERGNVYRLAKHYRKDPKQVYRWLKRHGLDPNRFR
jgi:hypothetical protein